MALSKVHQHMAAVLATERLCASDCGRTSACLRKPLEPEPNSVVLVTEHAYPQQSEAGPLMRTTTLGLTEERRSLRYCGPVPKGDRTIDEHYI
jgi:hypothetical protein